MRRLGLLHALLAVGLGLATPKVADAQSDVIRGRVTNIDGNALSGVRVSATSIPGNVTREVRTDGRGNYQIIFPGGTGDYMMGFALIGYVYRVQQVKRLADEEVLIANITLQVVQLDTITVAAPVQQRVNRNQQTPDVSGTERPINTNDLPANLQGDLAAMAASLPGVLLVPGLDGGSDGFSVLGLGTDANSTTLNGSPFGANNLPRDANVGTSLTTSPFDVSRGGFSGGNFNITTPRGNNFRTRGSSFVINVPQLEWTDAAGRALGSEYTNVSMGGIVSGPLVLNKAFYNVSYQFGRRASDNQTLLDKNTVGLQTAGVAVDSVNRLLSILQAGGVPGLSNGLYPQRLSDNGSVFGSVDVSPPNATSGASLGFTFNGNWSKQAPAFGTATQLPSSTGDRTNWSGGLQTRHSAYIKMLLTETTVGLNLSRNEGTPYLDLPGGRVRVTSNFNGGASGVQNLVFGGNQNLSSRSRSNLATFSNTLSWFDNGNKHRVKLSTELQYNNSWQNPASNLLGTFAFNSLSDLENGVPSEFSRTLSVRDRTTESVTGSLSIGDSYRRTLDFQLQYGLRFDATKPLMSPDYNPAVEAAFGKRNDRIPAPIAFSPRIGFSWTLGDANEIQAFFGQARAPRAVVRGGIGVFANGSMSGQSGASMDATGLPTGTQQFLCVGPAVPTPNWALYNSTPDSVPETCANGLAGVPFSNASPNVILFNDAWTNPKSIRSNLSWQGAILDARFTTNIEGSYSLNLNRERLYDLNFDNLTRFTLSAEGRPVYVDTGSIVPATGGIAARDARISQSFARVSEVRSDLKSHTAQMTVRLSPIIRTPVRWGWNAAYTYQYVREQVSGFGSTDGSPRNVFWDRSEQGPHQISYGLRYSFFNAVHVNWNGQFRSGSAYTPMVAGDVNGDGYGNDRAFVWAPGASPDSATNAGMTQLLANGSDGVRSCLNAQVGRIASRGSCRAPWSSSASLNVTLDRVKFHMPQRFNISFSLQNPMGAADLLMHGSGSLRGWGQTPTPDRSLLYVRGFDATTQTYRYEVNQRFGATLPQFLTLRSPVVLTTSIRVDMGPTRERQNLEQQLGTGRNRPGTKMQEQFFRTQGPNSVSNPLSQILRQADTLKLTAVQADSIAVLNRRYTYRSDSIWAPAAKQFAGLSQTYDASEQYERYLHARRAQIDMLAKIVPLVNDLLTPEQRRKLPTFIVSWMDPRYLASVRSGTNTYVGSGGGGPAFGGTFISFGGGEMMMRMQ
jgi:hypothetical protein